METLDTPFDVINPNGNPLAASVVNNCTKKLAEVTGEDWARARDISVSEYRPGPQLESVSRI
jgi:hypothetical protein